MEFAKLIADAQKLPEPTSPSEGEEDGFGPLPPVHPEDVPLVTKVPKPGGVPGVPGYNLDYKVRRFYVGKELVAIEENRKIFEPRDESGELMDVMDKALKGEAVVFVRKDSILQDGSVVVWLEWGEPTKKKSPAREQRDYLTTAELKSPERVTPRSVEADAAEDGPKPPPEDEDPSTDDEDDW